MPIINQFHVTAVPIPVRLAIFFELGVFLLCRFVDNASNMNSGRGFQARHCFNSKQAHAFSYQNETRRRRESHNEPSNFEIPHLIPHVIQCRTRPEPAQLLSGVVVAKRDDFAGAVRMFDFHLNFRTSLET